MNTLRESIRLWADGNTFEHHALEAVGGDREFLSLDGDLLARFQEQYVFVNIDGDYYRTIIRQVLGSTHQIIELPVMTSLHDEYNEHFLLSLGYAYTRAIQDGRRVAYNTDRLAEVNNNLELLRSLCD